MVVENCEPQVVQNLATGEIADSVREIASFRTKIKDIGSKVAADFMMMVLTKLMMLLTMTIKKTMIVTMT